MTRRRLILAAVPCVLAIACGVGLAQRYGWRRQSPLDGLPADRAGVPDWKVDERFKDDVFTFVRVQYDSLRRRAARRGGWGGGWTTDWPDSDLNFSFRLQQLTSLKVNPEPIIAASSPTTQLFDYPFIYMIEPGDLVFSRGGGASPCDATCSTAAS